MKQRDIGLMIVAVFLFFISVSSLMKEIETPTLGQHGISLFIIGMTILSSVCVFVLGFNGFFRKDDVK